jgi:quercetin dioxygenase-like cupin family protein
VDVKLGSVAYIPANTIHAGKATPEGDVLFFTVKDASHSLHGIKAA